MKFAIVKKAAWFSLIGFLVLTCWLWLPLLVLTAPVWAFCGFLGYWTWAGFRKSLNTLLHLLYSLVTNAKRLAAALLLKVRKSICERDVINLGYAVDTPTGFNIRLDPEDDRHRFALQLYHFVGTGLRQFSNLRGFHIIELNCAQGAGLNFLLKSLRPASALGLTASAWAAARLNRDYASSPTLHFHSAAHLSSSVRANSADAVLSIELTPHPAELRQTVAEVYRVLKPGGHFFYAGWCDVKDCEEVVSAIEAYGAVVTQRADITHNVLRSIELEKQRTRESRFLPRVMRRVARFCLVAYDDYMARKLQNGAYVYLAVHSVKPKV